MFWGEFICLLVCVHDYFKSNEQILMKLFMRIVPRQKEWLNFEKDSSLIPDTKKNPESLEILPGGA